MKLVCALGIILGLIGPRVAFAEAPTADHILKKCLAAYDTARTFQGVETFKMQDKDQQSLMTLRIKTEKGSDGMIARTVLNFTKTVTDPTGAHSSHQDVMDDGTTAFAVKPDQKQYSTSPHTPDKLSGLFFSPFNVLLQGVRKAGGKWNVSVARSQNRAVYKLLGTFPRGEVQILIDKLDFHLYSLRGTVGQGASRSLMEITVSQQVFDQPLPQTVFTWSPPSDYTQITDTGQISPQ